MRPELSSSDRETQKSNYKSLLKKMKELVTAGGWTISSAGDEVISYHYGTEFISQRFKEFATEIAIRDVQKIRGNALFNSHNVIAGLR